MVVEDILGISEKLLNSLGGSVWLLVRFEDTSDSYCIAQFEARFWRRT